MPPYQGSAFALLFAAFFGLTEIAHADLTSSHANFRQRFEAPPRGSALACSAISQVLPGLGDPSAAFPTTIPGLLERLGRRGSTTAALVPFSRAPGATSLARPRVIMAVTARDGEPTDRRDSNDRVFMGVTTAPDGVQTLEFISWNQRRKAFDFGVVENYNRPARRRLVMNDAKTRECLQCHKTGGPIFPNFPWSGTAADPLVGVAMLENAYRREPDRYRSAYQGLQALRQRTGNDSERFLVEMARARNGGAAPLDVQAILGATARLDGRDTGIPFLERGQFERVASFDGAVRNAARAVLLPNQIAMGLPRDQRLRFLRSMVAQSLIGPFKQVATPPGSTELVTRLGEYAQAERARLRGPAAQNLPQSQILSGSHPSQLLDFNPATGQINDERRLTASHSSIAGVQSMHAHSEARDAQTAVVPPGARPSNTGSFAFAKNPPAYTLRQAVLSDFAASMGLRREDVTPLLNLVTGAAPSNPTLQEAIVRAALESNEFSRALEHGVPTRNTLLAGLSAALTRQIAERGLSATTEVNPPEPDACDAAAEDHGPTPNTPAPSPTRLCAGCHSGSSASGFMRFPFDPQDRAAWETRLAAPASRDSTLRLLNRVVRRIEERDMPPADSAEWNRPEREGELGELRRFLLDLRAR